MFLIIQSNWQILLLSLASYQKVQPVMLLHIKAIGHVVRQNIPARLSK